MYNFNLSQTSNGVRLIGQRSKSIHIGPSDESENGQPADQEPEHDLETGLSEVNSTSKSLGLGTLDDEAVHCSFHTDLYDVLDIDESWANQFFADTEPLPPQNQASPSDRVAQGANCASQNLLVSTHNFGMHGRDPRDFVNQHIGSCVPMLNSGRSAVPQAHPQPQLLIALQEHIRHETAPPPRAWPAASPSIDPSFFGQHLTSSFHLADDPRGTGGPIRPRPAADPRGLQQGSRRGKHVKDRPEMQLKARAGKPSWEQVCSNERKQGCSEEIREGWGVVVGGVYGSGGGSRDRRDGRSSVR
jgi:hypothetical protein